MGSNTLPWWACAAYLFAGIFVSWQLSLVLLSALYQYVLYPRWRKRSYDPGYLPRCSIILPCKGTPRHLQDNLLAFLRQAHG